MVLAIDIGNTNIAIGGFTGESLSFVVRLSTNASLTSDEYAAKILGSLAVHGVEKTSVKGAIISSVVPPLNKVMREAIRLIYGVDPITVGPGIKTGIGIRCDDPVALADTIAKDFGGKVVNCVSNDCVFAAHPDGLVFELMRNGAVI